MNVAMAKVLVLYNAPSDTAAFDSYYQTTHIPIAKKLPGLLSYTVNVEAPRMIAGTAPHLIAELEFASMAAIDAALASPEGQATAADLANFAQAGVTIMMFDTKPV
jgi:uncharacterized protein (TIGR02118 family)